MFNIYLIIFLHISLKTDVENDPDCQKQRYNGTHSVAEERQRKARIRQNPGDDTDIDEGLIPYIAGNSCADQPSGHVPGPVADIQTFSRDGCQQKNDRHAADKSKLLSCCCKDEIRMCLRNIAGIEK